jgi:hypothetical protein
MIQRSDLAQLVNADRGTRKDQDSACQRVSLHIGGRKGESLDTGAIKLLLSITTAP